MDTSVRPRTADEAPHSPSPEIVELGSARHRGLRI